MKFIVVITALAMLIYVTHLPAAEFSHVEHHRVGLFGGEHHQVKIRHKNRARASYSVPMGFRYSFSRPLHFAVGVSSGCANGRCAR